MHASLLGIICSGAVPKPIRRRFCYELPLDGQAVGLLY
jgi:hypothetical protein